MHVFTGDANKKSLEIFALWLNNRDMTQTALFDDGPAKDDDSTAHIDASRVVSVLVPYPVDKAYSYILPEGMQAETGDYVVVPLGSREIPAVVWGDAPDDVPVKKLKTVIAKYDFPPMASENREFLDWTARYNMAPRGYVMKMALSVPAALEPPKAVTAYKTGVSITDKTRQGLSPQRQKVLDVLSDGIPRRAAEIADAAGCSAAVVKGMLDKHLVEKVDIYSSAPCRNPDVNRAGAELSEAQDMAAQTLVRHVQDGEFKVSLLDGVTGAGKTEVYFEAVAEAIKNGKQVLILLPEIALSNAFLDRFKKRFGVSPALWHSALSSGQRKTTWRGVADGQTKVVIGARSALFLPFQDLGLIIVDEEHDPAYKQEDNVIYHARDMAVVRGHMGKFPVVLVSATPSLETITNAWAGKYEHVHLPDRFGGAHLPDMHLIDMRHDKPERGFFIAPQLKEALAENLEKGGQSLLFLNRRGYAPLTLCRSCGHRMECPRCTAWLVEHKSTNRLHCHHCGYNLPFPKTCPECGDEDSLHACGPGVERILEEVKHDFPEARTVVLASDTANDHETLKQMLSDIRAHKYDIIIGTQIIAKGHHFPNLTLVGVIDADLGLQGGDLRAAERTYQLLHQVAGRAGREQERGHVYLQTWFADNKVMQALASHNRDDFLEIESSERAAAHMPPYSRLVGLIVSGKDEKLVAETAQALARNAPHSEKILTLGPAEAPFYRLRGNYRRRLLVRADKDVNIQNTIEHWVGGLKIPSTIRVYIDIDPQSFL